MSCEVISEHACFGGVQGFYRHASTVIGLPMRFGVFTPPQAKAGPVPALIYLAGLTCDEETFALKAGAQRVAAELGLMLVTPDTSPRDSGVPGADERWDFGTAAGFYLDATQPPWAAHDATALMEAGHRAPPLLIDQGEADKFLAEQLLPRRFEAACLDAGQPLLMRHHAKALHAPKA